MNEMFKFSKNEIRDLFVAYVVLILAFGISNVGLDLNRFLSLLPIIMIGVGLGFLFHEIAHKFVAIKYGYWSEFKLWYLGLVIALVTAFLGFVFAAPGEAHVYADKLTDEINGRIAIAGPMSNMTLAIIFIIIGALVQPISAHSLILRLIYLIATVGFSVNAFLATFNLFPVMTLDGLKVFKWNKKIWLIVFVIAAAMTLLSIAIGAENMVRLILGL
jgi:Zn-dependent protease